MQIIFVVLRCIHNENMFTINLGDGGEAPSKARKNGAKRFEFLVLIFLIHLIYRLKMEVTLYEASSISFFLKIRSFPRKIFYRNVEYFLRSEIGAYCGIDHGGIYTIPQIHLTRISLTRRMRDELRVQVILIFWPTKQKIVTISITMIMCMLYCLEFLVLIY